jgi:hypothetical protein
MEIPSHRLRGVPIKVALVERGLAQNEAAKLLHMRYSTFNMKLLGERNFTDAEKQQLSDLLGKPIEALFPSPINSDCVDNTQEEVA